MGKQLPRAPWLPSAKGTESMHRSSLDKDRFDNIQASRSPAKIRKRNEVSNDYSTHDGR